MMTFLIPILGTLLYFIGNYVCSVIHIDPLLLKRYGFRYNVMMSTYSFMTFLIIFSNLEHVTDIFDYHKLQHYDLPITLTLFTYSKVVEYLDTWFLILRKKPPITLQKFHHSGAVWVWYYVYNLQKNKIIIIPTLFNSFIHSIMYCYYAASIKKIKFPISKPVITTVQLIQLISGNVICYHMLPLITGEDWLAVAIFIGYAAILIGMFGHFFLKNYLTKSSRD